MNQVKLTVDDYLFLDEELRGIGYSVITKSDKSKDFFRLELQAPRPIKGSEIGYRYSNNEYTAKIWTSFLPAEQKFRDTGEDAMWPIITQADELAYSAKPIYRKSREDLMKTLRYAWVNKWKIDNIPLCPCCNARMVIFRKANSRRYMYACKKKGAHPDNKWRFRSWDYGLKEKAQAFVDIRRAATARYKEKMKALGKDPKPAAKIRKRWLPKNENNLISNRFN